jgi:nitrite reductase/ring-hydroxylating ferredoxin subunit
MPNSNVLSVLTDQPALDAIAKPLSQVVREVYASGGDTGRQLKNAAHGVWLGHPLHPVFTDLPIGAWTTALVLDATAAANQDRGMARAANVAVAVGLIGALGAAVTGLTDWSETSGQTRRTGLVHGLMNLTATTLFATSYVLRKNRSRRAAGRNCSTVGYVVAMAAAYLGGNLVYDRRVGVTHADVDLPEDFTPAASSDAVADGTMIRAHAGDADVLLARRHGRVCALVHSCAHMGGPLSEGTLKDDSVVCPWHGSEYALDDGTVLNGPATQNQPCLAVRERNGQIEVKAGGD